MFKKEIDNISLDFDGVVVDSTQKAIEEIIAVGESLTGRKVSSTELMVAWGVPFETFLSIIFPETDLQSYFQERERLEFNRIFPALIPGALEAIETLSAIFPISLITNREAMTLFEIMEDKRINLDLFSKIQSCSNTDFHKPDPRVFNDLLVRHKANHTLYLGDHLIDQQAAWGAGINFVGVLSGGITTREEFLDAGVHPSAILNSIADLPAYLGF